MRGAKRRRFEKAAEAERGGGGSFTGLGTVRVAAPTGPRELGRRDKALAYQRLFIPSLVIDQTEAMLRRYGNYGEEGIGLWAGTLAGGDGFVSTLVTPGVSSQGRFHGELSADTMAAVLARLDELDLVLLAQIHSHPREAFLSSIDAERPAIAVAGFISVVIPDFGFVDVADVDTWAAYEYFAAERWSELDAAARRERLIVDPSLLAIQ